MRVFVRIPADANGVLEREVWEFVLSHDHYNDDSTLKLSNHGHYIERRKTERARTWEKMSGWWSYAQRWENNLARHSDEPVPPEIMERAKADILSRIVFK